VLCRTLGVSRSGFYRWSHRTPSNRALCDDELAERIVALHTQSRETYGAPRIHADLRADDVHVSNKRVSRLMREYQIAGASRRKGFKTTVRDREAQPAPDLVQRNFVADRPDQLWVADITYVPTMAGFYFLAVVLDAFSRRVVGWAMANNLKTELVSRALEMATTTRRPQEVVHHSDQGTQYTSIAFGLQCREAGVRPSMGSVGDCFDNAMCESFFATLECELFAKTRFRSHREASMAIFEFIEGWYNPSRRHSAIGYLSPEDYERQWIQAA